MDFIIDTLGPRVRFYSLAKQKPAVSQLHRESNMVLRAFALDVCPCANEAWLSSVCVRVSVCACVCVRVVCVCVCVCVCDQNLDNYCLFGVN